MNSRQSAAFLTPSILLAAVAATCGSQRLPAQRLLHRFPLQTVGSYQSIAICNLDGDGIPDIAMIVPGSVSGGTTTVPSYLRGFSGASPTTLLFQHELPVWDYEPSMLFMRIDGDGVDDLILAEPGYEPTGGINRGRVRAWTDILGLGLFAQPVWELTGQVDGELLGSSLGGVGAWDSDTVQDVAIGASGYCSQQGYVRVVSGATGITIRQFTDPQTCTYFGSPANGVGDIDGDGKQELLVGANEHSVAGSGRAVLFRTQAFTTPITLLGLQARDHFGTSVSGIGSVNGDAVPDFAVGADQHELSAEPGFVTAYNGSTAVVLWRIAGTSPRDYFGSTVIGLGDVNGDGVPDIAIAAPQPFAASSGGYVDIRSGDDGRLFVRLIDPTGTGGFGSRLHHGGTVGNRQRMLVGGTGHVDLYEFESGEYRPYGVGCRGTNGQAPVLTATSGVAPAPGRPYRLVASSLPAAGSVTLVLGWDDRQWGPFALPFDLTPAGMPTCLVLTSSESLLPMQRTGTSAQIDLQIPAMLGLSFYAQVLARDFGANPLGYVLSNAIHVRS